MKACASKSKSRAVEHASPTAGSHAVNTSISTAQLSVDPHTPDTSISHIARLPPELHLRLLSKLSARDIQKCRRLDHFFRGLIDHKPNHGLCTGPGISCSLDRLKEQLVEFSNFPLDTVDEKRMPTGFLNAFARFVRFHGLLAADEEVYQKIIELFAVHWYYRWHQISHPDLTKASQEEKAVRGNLIVFAWTIVHEHITVHDSGTPRDPQAVRMATLILESAFTKGARETIGITTDEQIKLFIDEILLPSGALSRASFHEQYTTPEQIGRPLLYVRQGPKLLSRGTVLRVLNEMLGIPHLPWCTPAGLFVSSEWAVEEVKMMLESRGPYGHVKRAALLEEMFLHFDPDVGMLWGRA